MNISNAFPATIIVVLAGALVFLWIFYRLVVKFLDTRPFLKRNLWKLMLAGFIVIAFWGINSLMFYLEAGADERFEQALTDFNGAKDQIEIVGIEDPDLLSYGTDGKSVLIAVRDSVTKETVPCAIKNDKVYVFLNESVSEPFILFNSTENTIDIHYPAGAVEKDVEKIDRNEWKVEEVESQVLQTFLRSLDQLEE